VGTFVLQNVCWVRLLKVFHRLGVRFCVHCIFFLFFLVTFFFFDFIVLENDEFVVKKPEEAARMEGSPSSVNEVVDTIPVMVSKLSINELSANLL
jgi:hypothetical protein